MGKEHIVIQKNIVLKRVVKLYKQNITNYKQFNQNKTKM
jgi:hypothetical protein